MIRLSVVAGGVLLICLAGGCDQLRSLSGFLTGGAPAITLCPPIVSDATVTQANTLLTEAIRVVDARQSISAQVHLTINVFGQQMVGSGSYLEQGYSTTRQARFDTSVQMAGRAATLLDVCDGRNIWFLRECGEERILSWVDLSRVSAAVANTTPPPQEGLLGIWRRSLGFGKTLRRMEDSFRFHAVEQSELQQVPMWKLTGTWKPDMLARLAPTLQEKLSQGKSPNFSVVGPQVPDHIVLYLGKEDLFPYRWEFHRCYGFKRPRTPLAARGSDTLMLAVQWSHVAFNAPLDPVYFTYNPGGVKPLDMTQPVIQHHGLKEPKPVE